MRDGGVMTTCVPLRVDGGDWESAVFFDLAGAECEKDREQLSLCKSPLPVTLEADVINNPQAAVVMLRFEISTRPGDPLVGEVLLTPGSGEVQYATLEGLTRQERLLFFFGNEDYRVIHSQQLALGADQRNGYQGILDDAVSHDALIRLTGRYDATAAMREVTSHYATHVVHGG